MIVPTLRRQEPPPAARTTTPTLPTSPMAPNSPQDDPAHPDVVDEVVQTVKARLAELQPYLDEAERLRAILAASEGRVPAAKPAGEGRRTQGSSKAAIMAVIAERPGVTAADIARVSGMKRTVVASTVSRLKRVGELEPEGRGVRLPGTKGDAAA